MDGVETQNFASPLKKINMEKYQNKYRIDTTRLKNWDYGSTGFYFVTICTRHHENYFGDIIQPIETLNFASLYGLSSPQLHPKPIGKIARQYWSEIPNHFPFVVLDEFVIMPDHLHGILYFDKPDRRDAKSCVSTVIPTTNKFAPQSQNLGSVIRGYKAAVKKYATMNSIEFAWQPRYHDHVIHTERELQAIRRYIQNNPKKWMDKTSDLNVGMKNFASANSGLMN